MVLVRRGKIPPSRTSPRQDQRPPHRSLGVEQDGVHRLWGLGGRRFDAGVDAVEFGGEDLGVGFEKVEPVDDETLQSGVGTVAQQGMISPAFPMRSRVIAARA